MLVASYAACSILRVLTQWGATLVIISERAKITLHETHTLIAPLRQPSIPAAAPLAVLFPGLHFILAALLLSDCSLELLVRVRVRDIRVRD